MRVHFFQLGMPNGNLSVPLVPELAYGDVYRYWLWAHTNYGKWDTAKVELDAIGAAGAVVVGVQHANLSVGQPVRDWHETVQAMIRDYVAGNVLDHESRQ